jgi:two-component system, NtrC family, response regulator AtoC
MAHALIVDDSPSTLESLEQLVKLEGFTTATALTIDQARVELSKQPPDVVLVDLNLPDGSGLNLLDSINGLSETSPAFVLITGQASLDSAVEALRRGVSDYLTKPLDVERLRKILQDISQTKRLPDELRELRSEQQRTGRFVGIVGRSDPIVRACELISRIAPSSASVLITGESGSGKDVVARAIHELSRRRHGPWVPVNCGAISPSLMESELFGHERGSFTGAERRHKGYFEQATRGTLFLDEITEMPIELQVKLLRVLETNSLSRVGGEQPIQIDVRVLAASNRDVQQAIDEGKLRADLYYRLKVFQIDLAPLRSRREDIRLLAQAFLEDLIQSEGRTKRFSDQALDMLGQYNWPGNVRELRNVVHFAYVLSEDLIEVDSLPAEVQRGGRQPEAVTEAKGDSSGVFTVRVGSTIAEVERRLILATLKEYQEDKPKSASVLGISLKTLYNRLNQYQAPESGGGGQTPSDDPSSPQPNQVEVAS